MKRLIFIISLLFIINILAVFKVTAGFDLAVSLATVVIIYIIISYFTAKIYKNDKNIAGILFYIAVAVILGQGIIFFTYTKTISINENRLLAAFPNVNPFHEEFADDMDKYINDRIGLRDFALGLYSRIDFFDDINLSSKAIDGKNGWLFLNDGSDSITYFQRVDVYTPEKLEAVKEIIEKNKKFCEDNGIDCVLIIPPNKSTIYPEYYNKYIRKKDGVDNYLILKEYIEENFPDDNIIMPYDELMASKEKTLYYSRDTHWNAHGAYTAYKILENTLSKIDNEYSLLDSSRVVECEQMVLTDLEYLGNKFSLADKTYNGLCIKGVGEITLKENDKKVRWQKAYGGAKAPRILLIHDSYMKMLAPFISAGASYIGQLWVYEKDFNKISDIILEYNPDIIIWESLERYWF